MASSLPPRSPESADEIIIVDATDLADVTAEEARLLAEQTDLRPWEKLGILSVVRSLDQGDYLGLLGLAPGSDARQLKRAYFELSKQLHPDRYFGRDLGAFGPLLERLFAQVAQFVKTLSDSRTVIGEAAGPAGPRRRRSERLPFAIPATLAAGGHFQLKTVDLGDGGAFVESTSDDPQGAMAAISAAATASHTGHALQLQLEPDGAAQLVVRAQLVWARPPELAARMGRRSGLGLRFLGLEARERAQLEQILALARRAAPRPAAQAAAAPAGAPPAAETTRFARGTGRVSLQRPIIGIDLGTSYTAVAAVVAGKVQILPWPDGSRAIPSVIAFPRSGEILVGNQARTRALRDPAHAVTSAKRLLGRRIDEPELAPLLAQAAFSYRAGPGEQVIIEMHREPFAVAQLCAYLLAAARRNAERVLGQTVDRAVVTVPVSFTAERVRLLRRAGQLAQLQVVEVIEEPSAAALACRHTSGFGGTIGLYDFGGGTFDFSLVDARGGDFRVLTTAGDTWLGGDDLDYAVAEAAANLFWRTHGVDLRKRQVEWQRLLVAAEKAKRDLSTVDSATLVVPEVMHTRHGPRDLRIKVARERAEPIWQPAIERSLKTSAHAMAIAGVSPAELSAIYLSGGTSYVPAVRRGLSERFGVPVRVGAPPDHAVCLGAGIHAAQLERTLPTQLPSRL